MLSVFKAISKDPRLLIEIHSDSVVGLKWKLFICMLGCKQTSNICLV